MLPAGATEAPPASGMSIESSDAADWVARGTVSMLSDDRRPVAVPGETPVPCGLRDTVR